MILGLALTPGTQALGGFTPADIPTAQGWWRASKNVFKTGPAPAGDGDTVLTWVDTLNSLTLTRTAESTALALDTDGAPTSKPAIIGTGGALSRMFAANFTSPWLVAVVRLDWAGSASLVVDSQSGNRIFCSRPSATSLNIFSGTTVTGNTIADATWGLLIIDWGVDGAFSWDGSADSSINTGSNANAAFVWGRDFNGATPTNYAIAELIVGDGKLTTEETTALKAWAAATYGI